MTSTFEVTHAAPLMPDGVSELARIATAEGIANVQRALEMWIDGRECFEGPGETLLVALDGTGSVVGLGGLSQCPHASGALRMRRFYISPSWRRSGVATALATRLITLGLEHTTELTCNAQASKEAAPFWESLGFRPVERHGFTHHRLIEWSV